MDAGARRTSTGRRFGAFAIKPAFSVIYVTRQRIAEVPIRTLFARLKAVKTPRHACNTRQENRESDVGGNF
jgi:hypothetical protein